MGTMGVLDATGISHSDPMVPFPGHKNVLQNHRTLHCVFLRRNKFHVILFFRIHIDLIYMP